MTTPKTTTARKGRDLEVLQSEILADAASGPIAVELVAGVTVRVLPPRMWRISSLTALKEGDFVNWAKKAMASTEDYQTFVDTDPTLEDLEKFMQRFGELSDPGN